MNCSKLFGLIISGLSLTNIAATANTTNPGDSIKDIEEDYIDWYNLSPEDDKILGAAVNKAYLELLADKPAKRKITVAVIDAGVDIDHEDLKDKIWVNQDEIAGNGIDDDKNGYVDDIHGWNFLGNAEGENIHYANYEFVRILREYDSLFADVKDRDEVAENLVEKYDLYAACKKEYEEQYEPAKANYEGIKRFIYIFESNEKLIQKELGIDRQLTEKDLVKITSESKEMFMAVAFFERLFDDGFTYEDLEDQKDYIFTKFEKHLNKDFVPREIIGDNLTRLGGMYGNNDVEGPRATHGSLVAGVIAATRDNGLGINGIADAAEIMVLRTVPDGDEYDKDVARSIIYAVDNGADIINMSFGKGYSPQKQLVDSALSYAASKNVLLVHASGNDASDNDVILNYPAEFYGEGDTLANWMVVGAVDQKKGKTMVAEFSNYGRQSVDIMAPGVNIVSTFPGGTYTITQGTSFSAPVVSGVAALVWSRYPELTARELKQVLMQSAYTDYYKKKVYQPTRSEDKDKVRFYELSKTGGMVNAYQALNLAAEMLEEKPKQALK